MRNPVVTGASNKLAKAQEVRAAKGARAAVPLYLEAADALLQEGRGDAAAAALLDLLNLREKKRGLFGAKEINPLGEERLSIARRFAALTHQATVTDTILELLGTLAAEFPDEPAVRFANAEALYRAAYIADAIDEYRYCAHLDPDDGTLAARLGELYAVVSRNSEAAESLRRGILRLREQGSYDGIAGYCARLVEVAPESAADVHDWIYALPDDAFAQQRADVTTALDHVRERNLDDGRWVDVEERLAALPEEVSAPSVSLPIAEEWTDAEAIAQASGSDEMSMLLASSTADTEEAFAPVSDNGATDYTLATEPPVIKGAEGLHVSAGRVGPTESVDLEEEPAEAVEPTQETVPEAAPPTRPTAPLAGSPLPPGLAAYTRRKGDTLYAAGDFAGAAPCYERLLKAGFDPEIGSLLLDCYMQSGRSEQSSELAMQLADAHAAVGEVDKAVDVLSLVLQYMPNASLEQRRAELLATAGR